MPQCQSFPHLKVQSSKADCGAYKCTRVGKLFSCYFHFSFMEIVLLYKARHLTDGCCDVLNEEWSRSKGMRFVMF